MSKSSEYINKAEEFLNEKSKETLKNVGDILEESKTAEQVKALAKQANDFVQQNPWLAVVGALAIGYILGSSSKNKHK